LEAKGAKPGRLLRNAPGRLYEPGPTSIKSWRGGSRSTREMNCVDILLLLLPVLLLLLLLVLVVLLLLLLASNVLRLTSYVLRLMS
jgi:hypothetical protein